MKNEPTLFVVDDDPTIRDSLSFLAEIESMNVETYSSADKFLESYDPNRSGCLVLDLRMPGMSGTELQKKLVEEGIGIPVIFLTAHGDVPTAVTAIRDGAWDFVQKPFSGTQLVERIRRAFEWDRKKSEEDAEFQEVSELLTTLTPRERQVLDLMVDGHPTKGIASELGTKFDTVRNQRASVLKKMMADSTVEVVRKITELRNRSK